MSTFDTRVDGIPCKCQVDFAPPSQAQIDEFDFRLLDRKGYLAPWLERKLDPVIVMELYDEYTAQQN